MMIERPLFLALLPLLAACSRTPDEPTSRPRPASAPAAHASAAAAPSGSGAVGLNIRWTDPPDWKRRPGSNPMRKFEYTLPRARGDSEDAELIVTSFGQGQGGSVDENIERWVRQLTPDELSQARRDKHQVGGFPVALVEADGAYVPMALPGGPPPRTSRNRFRLLGAIVETPSTLWFFKLIGPDNTVKEARSAFHTMIDSIR